MCETNIYEGEQENTEHLSDNKSSTIKGVCPIYKEIHSPNKRSATLITPTIKHPFTSNIMGSNEQLSHFRCKRNTQYKQDEIQRPIERPHLSS